MEGLLQRESRRLEVMREAAEKEKALLMRQLHDEQDRTTKECVPPPPRPLITTSIRNGARSVHCCLCAVCEAPPGAAPALHRRCWNCSRLCVVSVWVTLTLHVRPAFAYCAMPPATTTTSPRYYRGREEAAEEWSAKVQEGAVMSAQDADAATERRVQSVTQALKAEAEARIEKLRADAASKLQAVKHQAQMTQMQAAATASTELETAQAATQAAERAKAAAEARAEAAEASLQETEAKREQVVEELEGVKGDFQEATEKARAAVEKALASKRKCVGGVH